MINKLGIEELKPLLTKTKGEIGSGLRKIITLLNNFSQNVSTCRAPDFKQNVKNSIFYSNSGKGFRKAKTIQPIIQKDEGKVLKDEDRRCHI